ncbi:hypothetical protein BCV70DRAFT_106810 [Testicularia cyperi]|uniref:Uncharacterized protein n=1 Tax=Testicularia cyperi TaxID=1882483 RepID=A0A317XQZ1_9BASI|nr:hypothetical protein BCV70DRAFT_106810 [Testicularia cyperi]
MTRQYSTVLPKRRTRRQVCIAANCSSCFVVERHAARHCAVIDVIVALRPIAAITQNPVQPGHEAVNPPRSTNTDTGAPGLCTFAKLDPPDRVPTRFNLGLHFPAGPVCTYCTRVLELSGAATIDRHFPRLVWLSRMPGVTRSAPLTRTPQCLQHNVLCLAML